MPDPSDPSGSSDPVASYLRDARDHRRKQTRRGALVLAVSGLASGALATQMTDIGHATGFAGLGVTLMVGAAAVMWFGRRS